MWRVVILIAILASCSTPPTAASPTAAGPTVREIDIGGAPAPSGLVFDFGSIWAGVSDTGEVIRLDPASGAVVTRIKAGDPTKASRSRNVHGAPNVVASGFGAVWASGSDGVLYRIEPKTNAVTQFPIDIAASAIAFGPDALWIASFDEGALLRVDPATGKVTGALRGQGSLQSIVVAFGSVWVTNNSGRELLRLDPIAVSVTTRIALNAAPNLITSGGDALWLIVRGTKPLVRVDPKTNVLTVFANDDWGSGVGLIYSDGAIWLGNVARVDASTGKTLGRERSAFADEQQTLVLAPDAVWIATNTRLRRVPLALVK